MRTYSTKKLSIAALMCALTAVLAQIQIPLPPVPINLALLGVHLCACLTGWRMGAAAMAVYALLGAAGLPVLAGFSGGPAAVFGPTGGFVAGYILAAAAEGLLMRRLPCSPRALAAAMLLGTAVCYACGLVWFSATTGSALLPSFGVCVLPFLPGDALKVFVGVKLCLRLQKPLRAMGVGPESP